MQVEAAGPPPKTSYEVAAENWSLKAMKRRDLESKIEQLKNDLETTRRDLQQATAEEATAFDELAKARLTFAKETR